MNDIELFIFLRTVVKHMFNNDHDCAMYIKANDIYLKVENSKLLNSEVEGFIFEVNSVAGKIQGNGLTLKDAFLDCVKDISH